MADRRDDFADWHKQYLKQKEASEQAAVSELRELAAKLTQFKVKELCATYNGSGDSGDFEDIDLNFEDGAAHRSLEDVLAALNTNVDELTQKLWPLLPGGWEVDDGSFGTLTLDVKTGKIHREHNRRIESIDTTEDDF